MAEEEDSWIYDSVVGFLNSPVWMVPIESFVDQHCLVFDSGSEDADEYHSLHSAYKELVEELLESFTTDLHISSAQFIAGCNKGRSLGGIYTQGIIEYVFAAVNFDLFRSIMVRHNAALSLQALQMIKGGSADSQELEEEVMKFSETEYQTRRKDFDSRGQGTTYPTPPSLLTSSDEGRISTAGEDRVPRTQLLPLLPLLPLTSSEEGRISTVGDRVPRTQLLPLTSSEEGRISTVGDRVPRAQLLPSLPLLPLTSSDEGRISTAAEDRVPRTQLIPLPSLDEGRISTVEDTAPRCPTPPSPLSPHLFRRREDFDSRSVKEMADLEAALKKSRIDCETLLKDIERDRTVLDHEVGPAQADQRLYPEIPEDLFTIPKPSAPSPTAQPTPTPPTMVIEPEPAPEPISEPEPKAVSPAPVPVPLPAVPEPIPEPAKEPVKATGSLPPLKAPPPAKVSEEDDAARRWMEEAKASEGENSLPAMVATPQTIEERRAYWQQRKQEIVNSKRAAGLQTLQTHEAASARPKSARVAVRATAEPGAEEQQSKGNSGRGGKRPAMSSALAAALKREVINM